MNDRDFDDLSASIRDGKQYVRDLPEPEDTPMWMRQPYETEDEWRARTHAPAAARRGCLAWMLMMTGCIAFWVALIAGAGRLFGWW